MEKEKGMNKKGMIAQLVGAFVVILVGVSLIPIITKQVDVYSQSMNITGTGNITTSGFFGGNVTSSSWTTTVLNFMPAAFGLAILVAALGMVASTLKSSGLIGGGEEPDEEETEAEEEDEEYEDDDEDEDVEEYDDEEDDEEEEEDEDEEEEEEPEPEPAPKPKTISVIDHAKDKKAYEEKMKAYREKKPMSEEDINKNI